MTIHIKYSYEGCPTLQDFSESDAFMRGLMGPFGCLPADSEFLTPRGWKRMCDYLPDDLAAQWSTDGQISFVKPSAFIVLPCGEFIEFDSGSLVMQVSEEHRIPHYDWAGRFRVKTATEIERRPSKRTIPTTFQGHDRDSLGMTDDMIRFAVMMHADGHYVKHGNQAVVTVRKERKKDRARALLKRLGLSFAERVYPRRPTETLFVFEPPYRGKHYDELWWQASRRELAVVLDEMPHWDGLADHAEIRFFSVYKEDADFIQYAAHATGRRAAIHRMETENETWRDCYSVNIRASDNAKNRAQVRCDTTKITRTRSPDGLKYCFTVPTGFFIARCDDTIFVTGNSGKSSACVVEIVNRAQVQEPGPDGVRRSRWGVVRNCFDDETEILTEERGWQLFKDLEPEDRVASLHGDSIVFERPTMHYRAAYQGEMIGMKTQHIDMLVTPDHHLWVSKRQTRARVWSAFQHEKASDAYGRVLRRFRTTATWDGPADSRSVAFYKFLGFWFAEGYAGAYIYQDRKEPHWRCVVVQKDNLDLVREILREAGLEWGENVSKVSGCTYFRVKIRQDLKPLIRELADLGPAVRKRLPLWVKRASCEQLQAFLNGYLFGDGTYGGGTVVTACTSSRALADDLQEIAVKAGYAATIGVGAQRSNGKFKSNSDFQYRVSIRNEKRESPIGRGWYKREYDGIVYCVEVSTHVVLVRRNGKAHWSGQTYGELSSTTLKTIFQWLPPAYFGRYIERTKTYTVTAFPGCEFEIVLMALDRPDDVKRLLSLELTGAWVNEAREVPWGIIEVLQGRVGRYPAKKDGGPTWWGVWCDTNPPDADSRWYRYFEEKSWLKDFQELQRNGDLPRGMKPEQYAAIFKQPSGLSPDAENIPNLPGGRLYYANLAAGKSDEWKKIYIRGQYGFVVEGKLVYPEYSDEIHCRKADPIPGRSIIRSWDFGLTPACIFSQVLPTGQWLTFDEMTSDNMSVDEFGDDVLEHCTRAFRGAVSFEDWGDPAGENRSETDKRSCFDILQAKGIDIRAALTQEPTLRQEAVRKPLRTLVSGEPQFILHPRCKVLRKGFMGGYHRRRLQTAGPERYSDKPEKNLYSHPHDALQYGMVEYFGPGLVNTPQDDDDFRDRGGYGDGPPDDSDTGY